MAIKKDSPETIAFHTPRSAHYDAAQERDQNYIGKKISDLRYRAGLSLNQFSNLLTDYGVSVGVAAIHKWEHGLSAPNAYQLLAIGEALQIGQDYTYFMNSGSHNRLNADGIRKLADYRDDLIASGRYKPEPDSSGIVPFCEMPVSNLTASAGTGQFLDEGSFELMSVPESSVPDGAEFGIRVAGDSMEPVYHDGQIVWVQKCEQLKIGEVGIFVYDGEGYIKVYGEQMPDEAIREDFTDSCGNVHPQPVLVSYNHRYMPKRISVSSNFQIVGRVL